MKKIKELSWDKKFPGVKKLFRIMKLTAFLVLISMVSVFANKTYSQSKALNLNMDRVTVREVLSKIETQSEFHFMYSGKVIDVNRLVSIRVQDAKIDDALKSLFAGTEVDYTIKDRLILLTITESDSSVSSQQQKSVFGKVTDSSGSPLPGVSIVIKGTTSGIITDADGKFTLAKVSEDATLQFSFVGMKTQEMKLAGKTNINITMQEVAVGIDEVIAIGYGTVKKSDLTGAASSIKVDDLPRAANVSIENMLSGKAAGLKVQTTDAQPGGGLSILIRGAASTGAGNDPLYIIDGFPVSSDGVDPSTGSRYSKGTRSPLNSINPNDIESIEVLKDASATAIYGARAANGVILITTKSGKKGKVNVSYDFKQSFQSIANAWDVMDASEWMISHNNYRREKWLINNRIGPYGDISESSVASWIPAHTEAEIAQAGAGTNWLNEVTQTGKVQEHNVTISGASEETKYLLSFNSYDQTGVIQENNFNRLSGRLNLEQKIRPGIVVGVKATGSRISIDNPSLGTGGVRGVENSGVIEAANAFNPTIPVFDESGDYSLMKNYAAYPNPVSLLDITNNTIQDRLFVQSYIEVDLSKDLKFRSQLGFDKQEGVTKLYVPKTTIYGASYNGMATINQANKFDKLLNATISYKKELFDKHHLDALLGYEFQEFNWDGFGAGNTNFSTDGFLYNNLSFGQSQKPTVSSNKGTNMLASYFGRLNYSIKDKYLFTFTLRADGSTKFGEGNKFGYFPSGAFAWRLINENFMKNQDWISNLKLRLSVGQTGNSNISGAFSYYAFGANYLFGGSKSSGTYLESYANNDLKWETTTECNLGIDFGFLNNRISGALELYYKEVSDLLGTQQLKSYLIQDQIAANLGVTSSKGYELTINTINTEGAVRWSSDISLSAFKDRWKERSPNIVLASYESVKDPIRPIWGYETDGLIQPGETVSYMPTAKTGMLKIKDINGYDAQNNLTGEPDGKINNADIVLLGNYDPDFMFGFSNNFEYKNFDLNIHLYGIIGVTQKNDYLSLCSDLDKFENDLNFPVVLSRFWSSNNQKSKLPNPYVTNPYLTGVAANQPYMENASFVRVQNITLGYNMDGKILKSYFKKIRVYLNVTNPFLFTGYTGIDPEYSSTVSKYPSQKTYTVGLNLEF